jgi:hypothetical protein
VLFKAAPAASPARLFYCAAPGQGARLEPPRDALI